MSTGREAKLPWVRVMGASADFEAGEKEADSQIGSMLARAGYGLIASAIYLGPFQ